MIGAFKEDAESLGLRDLGKRTGKLHGCPPKPWTNDREFRLAERVSDGGTVSWCPSCGLVEGAGPKRTEVILSPELQKHIDTLKRTFDSRNQAHVFSASGTIDFHCSSGKITDVVEESSLDEESLKGLVLHFLEHDFFEPIFVVKNDGQLRVLKPRVKKSSKPGSPQLHPKYVWVGKKYFPGLVEECYSRDGQIKNALHHFDNEIAILNDLLSQLMEAKAIIHLAINLDETARLKSQFPNQVNLDSRWKIRVLYSK